MLFSFRLSLCLLALNPSPIGAALAQSQSSPSALSRQYSVRGRPSAFGLSALGLLQVDSRAQTAATAPSEEAALRAVIETYFSACGKKNLAGLVALWSEKSPELATYKQRLQQQLTNEELSFGSPAIARVKVEGEKASLRVTIGLTSIEVKGGQKREQWLASNIELVKEGGVWKVWRYASAAEELAAALVKADTEAEREGLLAEEKELVRIELGGALLAQGEQLYRQSSYQRAIDISKLALEIAEQAGDKGVAAGALRAIGNVHWSQGNYSDALEQFQKSLRISEEIGDKDGIARSRGSIGIVHQSQGDYTEALEQYQKSLRISEEIGDKAVIAKLLGNIGLVHQSQGNYAQALEQHRKSLRIREEIGDKAGIATALNNIGIVHDSQGNYTEALEHYQKSLRIDEEIGYKAGIARLRNNIGFVHQLQGDYAQALEQYQKSLKIAEEIGNKASVANTLNNIGDAYWLQGNHTQALQFAERAAHLATQIGHRETIWGARTTAGKAHFALKQFAQARQSFDQAIATIESLRALVAGGEQEQQRSFESKIPPYYAMVELLIAQHDPHQALSYAERARARVLLDVLSGGRLSVTKSMSPAEIEQERTLKGRLVSLNTQINRELQRQQPDQDRLNQFDSQLQKARLELEAFQTNLYVAHPELKPQRGEAPIINAQEIAALLPDPGSALLEYVVTDDHTYLFAITGTKGKPEAELRVYTLPIKRAELARQAESFRQQLAGRDLDFHAAARQLYRLLLRPARAQIAAKTNLIIVPDDKLWELPFQALVAEGDRYLIETSAVSYAPSLTVLREMRARHNKRRDDAASLALLALGNPAIGQETIERTKLTLRDSDLAPLPSAEEEVKALGRLYGAARSKIYIGSQASEDRVKTEAPQAAVLHFATHGILNDRSPMYSHLLLAQGDENEDGLLEAWELMELDLQADLAVLSACETARGRLGAGEGVIGLSWAMFVAGVPAILVSQWKVGSVGTRDLMLNFHRQLQAPAPAARAGETRAEALRQAARKLMKNPLTSHPFYWAGFVLVGDCR